MSQTHTAGDGALLVVDATQGVEAQTVANCYTAIDLGVTVLPVLNKMDLQSANPDAAAEEIEDVIGIDATDAIPCSAKTGMGIDNLLEMVALTAEGAELKANPNRAARGTVIEARMDKGRGPIMTVLVQNGTLHQGDIIIAGTAVGRVRTMTNDKGQRVTKAGPSIPVEIAGMSEVPSAGDKFNAVADERLARELVEQRKEEEKRKANAPSRRSRSRTCSARSRRAR